jgi:DNA repair exonuclease SbcCD ATPase subunit
MTVVRLDVDSFKRLRAAHVTPTPNGLVLVRGRNDQGKSSLIEAMQSALLGKAAAPELPITEGAHGSVTVVDLGELVVTKRWKRDSGGKATAALTVEAKDGSRISSPQAILDNLVGRFADPVAFLAMKPAEQVKTVLAVTGLDQQLQALEERAAAQFDQRRDLGRDADRLIKAEAQLALEVDGLPAPPTGGSVEALTTELEVITEHNANRERWIATRDMAGQAGIAAKERLAAIEVELARLQAEKDQLARELTAQREAWNQASMVLTSVQPRDPAPVMALLRQHEEAARYAGKRDLLEQTRAQAAEARAAHVGADAALEGTRTMIAELLRGAAFPIEGMAYDPDKKLLTIGGIPFSQASQSMRIKVAAAVAMAGDPLIQVLFARDGSLLDAESQQQLAALAEERGFQLWLEVVDSTQEGPGLWIEDGQAFGPLTEPTL